MKIFISFAGSNDLLTTKNPEGGAILNICKDLKPDKAYIFYNVDSVESATDFFAAASQTKPALERLLIDTREKVKDVKTGKPIPNPKLGKALIDCELVKIVADDPTDYNILYPKMNHALENIIESKGLDHEYYINITSGTPTMHLIWVLLHHQKKHLNSTLLRSLEKRHQKQYDNKPFIEVTFSLDDFPQIQTPSAIKRQLTIERREKANLKEKVNEASLNASFPKLIGNAPKMLEIKEQIIEEVNSTTHVLLVGERGTGKEVIANSIWELYRKKNDKELFTKDLNTIPSDLIDTELFGYGEGTWTGQKKEGKPGIFEENKNKIIFLDEIGNLSIESQTKLLRIIQFGTIERVGESRNRNVNVQLIVATNKDTSNEEIFAADVLDRFDEKIEIPPLRERKDDIPQLLDHFINIASSKYELGGRLILDGDIIEKIMDFKWPGNVRQLQKFVEKLVRKYGAREVGLKDLPDRIINIINDPENEFDFVLPELPLKIPVDRYAKKYERAIIEKARSLSSTHANVDRLLGQTNVEKNRRYQEKKKP